MKRILPLLAVLVTSCAAPFNTHFSDVHVGMSRGEVTKLLGKPVSAEGECGSEVLYIGWLRRSWIQTAVIRASIG